MTRLIDLTGRRFGRYVVLRRAIGDYPHPMWLCRCDCGAEKVVRGDHLRAGRTQSCRCYMLDRITETKTIHGDSLKSGKARLYGVWCNMKNRCYNPKVHSYKNYGGRGITICNEWKNDYVSFRKWAIENGYDEHAMHFECTIERLDNNGPYSPWNCTFISMREQAYNRRPYPSRNIEQLKINGEVVARWGGCKQAGEATGHSKDTISAACRGTRKTAYGYKWRYIG